MKHADKLRQIISSDPQQLAVLGAVRQLQLPDCFVGAGFVRNKVWDYLSGRRQPLKLTEMTDIDVVFFDRQNIDEAQDKALNARLSAEYPSISWECVNQARTHTWHNDEPYANTEEALAHWVETATAVAVKLADNDRLEICAPFGLDDLFNFIIRPTPATFKKGLNDFYARHQQKGWLKRWPRLTVVDRDE